MDPLTAVRYPDITLQGAALEAATAVGACGADACFDLRGPSKDFVLTARTTLRGGYKRPPFIRASRVFNESTLPAELRVARLSDYAPLGTPRFSRGADEAANDLFTGVDGIFDLWNKLDSIMINSTLIFPGTGSAPCPNPSVPCKLGNKHTWQTGYVREVQLRRMVQLVSRPGVSTYCEVGMNGGRAPAAPVEGARRALGLVRTLGDRPRSVRVSRAADSVGAMLRANPRLVARVVDLQEYKYSEHVAHELRRRFGERFLLLPPGRSEERLPQLVREMRNEAPPRDTCDVVFVDGVHSDVGVLADLAALRRVSTRTTTVLIDDIHLGPAFAVAREQAGGRLEVRERYGPFLPHSAHNPCMRSLPGQTYRTGLPTNGWARARLCQNWGFVVAAYAFGGFTRGRGM